MQLLQQFKILFILGKSVHPDMVKRKIGLQVIFRRFRRR